jgi:hypothetical protein
MGYGRSLARGVLSSVAEAAAGIAAPAMTVPQFGPQHGDPMQFHIRQIEVIDDEMTKILRQKTGAERLRIASDMYASARRMLISHLRAEHGDWDEARVILEAARRLSHGAF